MFVTWPDLLWLLLVLPLLLAGYLRHVRRRQRQARRFASLASVGPALGARARHLPAALLFLGVLAMLLALARPQALVMLPARAESVILAMDSSGSMRATDVQPDRITAAQNAARTFVEDQPSSVKIGVVAIASTAAVVQSPTQNREDLYRALERLQLQRGTALGSGIVIALATLLPEAGIDVKELIGEGRGGAAPREGEGPRPIEKRTEKPKPLEAGSNTSAAIVLLSDGQSNTGPDPIKMSQVAADHGVRIFTVGIGTPEGTTLTANGWSMRVKLDEDVLKKIATTSGGEYFRAANARELKKIYQYLSARLTLEKMQQTEVTALFAALGAALAMSAALISLLWFNRIL
ncbi:MAG: VWA domain-containing protein, partial [Burkholderiales bacterium]|nr:VWA domain-containing protein [Burkholderiales bacterium]